MALHEQSVGKTGEWYTPPHVFKSLDCVFDIDVASPGRKFVPWIPTMSVWTCKGLQRTWNGFVWMNPPFGARNGIRPWLEKFVSHRNGIALTPDHTSAPWWQEYAAEMDAILFIAPKLKFIGVDGKPGASPAQGTCLMSLGVQGNNALTRARAAGLGLLMRRVDG
jgi:hypothetical protein